MPLLPRGSRSKPREQAGEIRDIETHDRDTVLTGDLDQPGLLGALDRIQGLGLEVVGFTCRLPPDAGATGLSHYTGLERGPA